MPLASINPGTIRKPPPMPKNPDVRPAPKPMPSRKVAAVEADLGVVGGGAPAEHDGGDRQHQQAEQRQQPGAVDHLAQARAEQRADHARGREHRGATPLDAAAARLQREIAGAQARCPKFANRRSPICKPTSEGKARRIILGGRLICMQPNSD